MPLHLHPQHRAPPGRAAEMDRLNELAPAIGGAAVLAYGWFLIFRIKRQQARSREKTLAK
jgi:hypothetical protein